MFGIYRFILAVLIAMGHVGFHAENFSPAVFAAIQFYIISGFTMTALFRHSYYPSRYGFLIFIWIDFCDYIHNICLFC
jgi:hypothetical protein